MILSYLQDHVFVLLRDDNAINSWNCSSFVKVKARLDGTAVSHAMLGVKRGTISYNRFSIVKA